MQCVALTAMAQTVLKGASVKRHHAQSKQVGGDHLGIQPVPAMLGDEVTQTKQGGFGTTRLQAEHGFTKEHAPDAHAINATDECLVLPNLHAVRVAKLMQVCVGGHHVVGDPCAGLPSTRDVGAGLDDLGEGCVRFQLPVFFSQ